jgi:hypothetical protein
MTNRVHTVMVGCVLVAVAALGCGACAAAKAARPVTTHTSAEPAIPTPPQLLDSAGLRLPVQRYMLEDEQFLQVERARVVLVVRCLARYGIDVTVPEVPDTSAYGPRTLTDRRYGITDRALAARYGLGLGPRDPALRGKPRQPRLGPAGRTVLTGQGPTSVRGVQVPSGGCLGQADRELRRGIPADVDLSLPQRLQFQSFELSKGDSRVRRVVAAWSKCMATAGYHYAGPLDTIGDPRFTEAQSVSDAQLRVARADLLCKQRTNLVGVWFTVDSAYENAAIAADAAAYRSVKAALDRERANAEAVVASDHDPERG